MTSRLQYAMRSESPLAMIFVNSKSACFAADMSRRHDRISPPYSHSDDQSLNVGKLTGYAITTEEQSGLRR